MRPIVVRELSSERENVVRNIRDYLKEIQGGFDQKKVQYSQDKGKPPAGEPSNYSEGIVYCGGLVHKVKQISTIVSKVQHLPIITLPHPTYLLLPLVH